MKKKRETRGEKTREEWKKKNMIYLLCLQFIPPGVMIFFSINNR